MANRSFLFSSESVGEGHPDKVSDQISDGVLDALLAVDPRSRVACETVVKNNVVILAGEITSQGTPDYEAIVRDSVRSIGYGDPRLGFDAGTCEVMVFINRQSEDISLGVTEGEGLFKEQGAGDQGLMFGFACDETPELMPLPISIAHGIMIELSNQRKSGKVDFLGPDAKSQVSVRYENGRPKAIETVVVSTQHYPEKDLQELSHFVTEQVVKKVIPPQYLTSQTKYLINPTGRFVVGGPVGDCGLTGRKIIVDTYGGYSRHGGGAFSGKDPSKVDRSAAYAARWIAKNVVAAGLATKCELQLAYAIGVAKPVSIYVETFGTATAPEEKIAKAIDQVFDLTPKGIIDSLQLLRPIYRPTAAYGHFGRKPGPNGEFSWEKTDRVEALKKAI